MKQLMLGNAAVARGLYEAGCCVISSYPGTPSTEITEEAVKFPEIYCEWAPNEKVAMEVAFGASLAGKRSFCGMKHVGLNVAADPLFTMSYTGVNGGVVIGVADDAGMHSSQNEQDSRHHAIAAKVPMLEPSDSAEALEFAKLAYDLSEQFDTPVLLKMCTRVAHSQSLVEPHDRVERPCVPYEKNIAKYVMMPGNAIRRHPFVEERTRKLQEWAETAPINRVEMGGTKMGIITSSTSYQYVKEVFGDSVSGLNPGLCRQSGQAGGGGGAGPHHRKPLPRPGAGGVRQGRAAHGGRVLPEPYRRPAGRAGTYRRGPGGGHPQPSPRHVRRLPPPRAVLHPEQK